MKSFLYYFPLLMAAGDFIAAVCETLLTPFLGIGSEAYQAIKYGRKAIGIELKQSYFNIAVQNLQQLSEKIKQPSLLENL